MASERFSYLVVEVKGFFAPKASVVQEKLVQLGLQGWELVSVLQSHHLSSVQLYMKKRL